MALPNELAKAFASLMSERNQTPQKEIIAYGNVIKNGDEICVQLDGTNMLTPVAKAMDAEPGDRVMVVIKDHAATIIGNTSCPASARTATNYMKLVDEGLIVGALGQNGKPSGTYSLIAPGVYEILDENDNVLASFAKDRIELGKGVAVFGTDEISLSSGMATFSKDNVTLGKGIAVFGTDSITLANGMASIGSNSVSLGQGIAVFGTDSISLGKGMATFGTSSITLGSGMAVFGTNSISLGKGMAVIGTNSISLGNGVAVFGTDSISLANGMAVISSDEIKLANGAATFSSNLLRLGSTDSSRIELCNGKGVMKMDGDAFVIGDSKVAVGLRSVYGTSKAESICRSDGTITAAALQILGGNAVVSSVVADASGVRFATPNSVSVYNNGVEIIQSNRLMAVGTVTAQGNIGAGKSKSLSIVVSVPAGYSLSGIRQVSTNHANACKISQFYTNPSTNKVGATFVNTSSKKLAWVKDKKGNYTSTGLKVTIEWFALRCSAATSAGDTSVDWGDADGD